jgi:adenine-specific DNA-methyltransferase
MANLSQEKRLKMLEFLSFLKDEHKDNDEALKAIHEIENEIVSKKYGLVWEEHEENVDIQMRTHVPVFLEAKDREIIGDEDNPNFNFLLEGDNLHSLKLLEKTHKGKIDVIYIDPPYNTGNEDFKYNDRFVEKEDGYRHSKWLSFMNKRLLIAKKLLSDKGIIFISIDDNEQAQLKLLCDDIFGEQNFLTKLTVKTGEVYGTKAAHIKKTLVKVKDYVIIYQMEKGKLVEKQPLFDILDVFYDSHYTHILTDGKKIISIIDYIKNDDFSIKKFKTYNLAVNKKNINVLLNLDKSFKDYFIKRIAPILYKDSQFNMKIPDSIQKQLKPRNTYNYEGTLLMKTSGQTIRHLQAFNDVLRWSDNGTSEFGRTIPRGDVWDDFVKDMGNVGKEGEVDFKNGKKPIRLIKQLIKWSNFKNSIILDFFAGSGTTGHAVIDLNKEDGGNRKYILCTNNENNICEDVTYQRLINIQEELPHNLKYYKTDFIPKIQDDEDNVLSDDLLNHIKEMVQLEHGIDIDNQKYHIILTDDDADRMEKEWDKYKECKALYISKNVLLTTSQNVLFSSVEINTIPDYYFESELREVGEIW